MRQLLEQQGFYSLEKPIGDQKTIVDTRRVLGGWVWWVLVGSIAGVGRIAGTLYKHNHPTTHEVAATTNTLHLPTT